MAPCVQLQVNYHRSPPPPPPVAPTSPSRSAPPTRTQVLFEHCPKAWLENLEGETRLYLYPVHPSRAFLATPSLASALYLLLLYLVGRHYPSAFRLVDACIKDTPLTREEAQLWRCVVQACPDFLPDASACRLKLYLRTKACRDVMPWPWSLPYEVQVCRARPPCKPLRYPSFRISMDMFDFPHFSIRIWDTSFCKGN